MCAYSPKDQFYHCVELDLPQKVLNAINYCIEVSVREIEEGVLEGSFTEKDVIDALVREYLDVSTSEIKKRVKKHGWLHFETIYRNQGWFVKFFKATGTYLFRARLKEKCL